MMDAAVGSARTVLLPVPQALAAGSNHASTHTDTSTSTSTSDARPVCAAPAHPGIAACMALIRTDVAPRAAGGVSPGQAPIGVGYEPASLRSAYNLPSASAGAGQTVAIVDAYNDPNAVSDLAAYRATWGLSARNAASGAEFVGEANDTAAYYNHRGVAVTAPAGDTGFGVEFPAASPDVVAVRGTSLATASNSRGWTESAWSGTGSGCSWYEPKPSWQTDNQTAVRRHYTKL
jgi:hypothetical protein